MRRSPACLLLLALAAAVLPAQMQIPCYTIDATPISGSGGGCVDIAVASDGCGMISVSGLWVCLCPFLPGTVTVHNWGMAVGSQAAWAEVPGAVGHQGLVPDVLVDLTQTAGQFGAFLPPPPTLSGLTIFVQLGAYSSGTTACQAAFAWHLSDTYQVTFT